MRERIGSGRNQDRPGRGDWPARVIVAVGPGKAKAMLPTKMQLLGSLAAVCLLVSSSLAADAAAAQGSHPRHTRTVTLLFANHTGAAQHVTLHAAGRQHRLLVNPSGQTAHQFTVARTGRPSPLRWWSRSHHGIVQVNQAAPAAQIVQVVHIGQILTPSQKLAASQMTRTYQINFINARSMWDDLSVKVGQQRPKFVGEIEGRSGRMNVQLKFNVNKLPKTIQWRLGRRGQMTKGSFRLGPQSPGGVSIVIR